ncbi:hypothetical protein EII25_06860 [Erysipelotrichaceae bacterium OH741_COT-311]|nr:hypothetical protein EII25_06860 [Erysipelotrichaceae bacterium OH741_COT-311]
MKTLNKNFKFDKNRNIPYSLHDSRVQEIKFHNNTLTLKIDSIFQYINYEEKTYKGRICFKDCDIDLCEVLIFNKTLGEGYFKGKSFYLEEFIEKYNDVEFEIITEGYFGNSTTYMGWLWEDGKEPVSAIMYIWNSGDMEYIIEEENI